MNSSFSVPLCGRGPSLRRAVARAVVAASVSVLAAVGVVAGAGTAVAEDGTARSEGGATATMDGLKTYGAAVIHGEDGDQEVSAGLFEMSVEGGGTLQTYCVDLHNPTQRDARYHETAWSGSSLGANADAGRIRWILRNSYPQVNDLAALAKKAGIDGGLTEQDAAAGTQVAIWRYSESAAAKDGKDGKDGEDGRDGKDGEAAKDGQDAEAAETVEAVDPQAERLADYLQKAARDTAEPAASLSLGSPAVSGKPGERLGPVTVHTGADTVTVTPSADAAADGVRIVDAKGEEVASARDGSRLYFDVPEDADPGSAEVVLQASTTVPVGRALTAESRSQTQVLAGSSESTVSATATAVWAEEGAVPALSTGKNCATSGVDIAVANRGDESYTFTLMGTDHTIAANASRTVTVPLQEDQAYDFTVTGPQGTQSRFTGVLDCETQSAETSGLTTQTLSDPSPATAGGTSTVDTGTAADLADTGTSSATPLIAGTAIGLVVVGGAALVLTGRKDKNGTSHS